MPQLESIPGGLSRLKKTVVIIGLGQKHSTDLHPLEAEKIQAGLEYVAKGGGNRVIHVYLSGYPPRRRHRGKPEIYLRRLLDTVWPELVKEIEIVVSERHCRNLRECVKEAARLLVSLRDGPYVVIPAERGIRKKLRALFEELAPEFQVEFLPIRWFPWHIRLRKWIRKQLSGD